MGVCDYTYTLYRSVCAERLCGGRAVWECATIRIHDAEVRVLRGSVEAGVCGRVRLDVYSVTQWRR